jgi:hypothetical protein
VSPPTQGARHRARIRSARALHLVDRSRRPATARSRSSSPDRSPSISAERRPSSAP